MKIKLLVVMIISVLVSCGVKTHDEKLKQPPTPIVGTWQLLSGTTIEKGDTVVTDYKKNLSFIKIINDTHFAFLKHDLTKGKDSPAIFDSGGGTYSLQDSVYTEHLEYCSERGWEGNDFEFTFTMKNDTLIQRGIEIVEAAGVNRLNIEKYIRLKN